ncbi:MAG: regulatory protein GemA [Magnetovibrionaceae bacterium]
MTKPNGTTKPKARRQKPADWRKAFYARIQIGKKALGLDEDTYRDFLEKHTGERSLTVMNYDQLTDVTAALEASGAFKGEPKRRKPPARAKAKRPLAEGEVQRKLRALWLANYNLAIVRDPGEPALEQFVKRMAKVDALQWLSEDQAPPVIEALKAMAKREASVRWEEPFIIREDVPGVGMVDQKVHLPRLRVLEAQWRLLAQFRLRKCNRISLISNLDRVPGFGHRAKTWMDLTDEEADAAMNHQGEALRSTLGHRGFETLGDYNKHISAETKAFLEKRRKTNG